MKTHLLHCFFAGSLVVVLGTAIAGTVYGCSIKQDEPTATARTAEVKESCNGQQENGNLTKIKNGQHFKNPSGKHATVSTRDGDNLDTSNPFFSADLGTNGRACVTCHAPEDGMSISAASIQARFDDSCGLDPLFTGDGAVAPKLDVSTIEARRAAFRLLLSKGLIRITLKIPKNAQFKLVSVDDPYGNSTADGAITVFRRPLPATNLKFLNVIMWDTREGGAEPAIVNANLRNQAANATIGHAEGLRPSDKVLQQIVDFELALFTAQVVQAAGDTTEEGATGGPYNLINQPYAVNENRFPLPTPPTSPPLGIITRKVFTIFDAWAASEDESRASVARGQKIFNEREITDLGPTINPPAPGTLTCSTCHNAFNAGNMSHSINGRPFGGVATVNVSTAKFRTPDLPLYTFQETVAPFRTLKTTDPGQALQTGVVRDWERVKSPNLRGFAAHPPFFRDGSAATIADVVDRYDLVMNPPGFTPKFTAQERADLIAFLGAL